MENKKVCVIKGVDVEEFNVNDDMPYINLAPEMGQIKCFSHSYVLEQPPSRRQLDIEKFKWWCGGENGRINIKDLNIAIDYEKIDGTLNSKFTSRQLLKSIINRNTDEFILIEKQKVKNELDAKYGKKYSQKYNSKVEKLYKKLINLSFWQRLKFCFFNIISL